MTPDDMERLEEALKTKMPHGEYRDSCLEDVPSDYLKWVAEYFSIDEIATKADLVWSFREKTGTHKYKKDM